MKNLRYRLAMRKHFWKEYFFTGEAELRELRNYVRKGSVAIDVGANNGCWSYHLSRFASRVHAFEPNPSYGESLARLRMSNVMIEPFALSSTSGEAELRFPLLASGREDLGMASLETRAVGDEVLSRSIRIPLRRLDDYGFDNVSLIKIDVEGHEEEALAGAEQTIQRNRPNLFIEIEERHNPGGLQRIVAKLSDYGYDGFFFLGGQRQPLSEFDDSLQKEIPADEAARHNRRAVAYINNFLFTPRDIR